MIQVNPGGPELIPLRAENPNNKQKLIALWDTSMD